MTVPDKTRAYRSPAREARRERTREAVLTAAERLFLARGYAGTTARAIADEAGVALDTVYAAVGTKPDVMLALLERAISGTTDAVPAAEREYVREIREAPGAEAKIRRYARALTELQPRLAPLVEVLRQAAVTDPACAAAWQRVSDRRADNMRLFVADLRATGELRPDLSDEDAADLVWSTNAPEYYGLLASRGWSAQRYGDLLADVWTRTLLTPR
ncbi:TetR/AcrR family transcriptional regulator [Cellulomonas cellasea]|uniref:AcrR family transcriptional regulator n=1 Tax=Cellulomonas cellasea TaxID=43670 RepID=A0A7W4UIG8_9CELL|nr:TetR/AcrR family transcriptional regulator [Cellulomonas cellasea]MBB2924794.1 AcrR family transcriptional regulator [Cellulomonas cellasea]